VRHTRASWIAIAVGATLVGTGLVPDARASGIVPQTDPTTSLGDIVQVLLRDVADTATDPIGIEEGPSTAPVGPSTAPAPPGTSPARDNHPKGAPQPTRIVRNPAATGTLGARPSAEEAAARVRQSRPARPPSERSKGRAVALKPRTPPREETAVKAAEGPERPQAQRPKTFPEVVGLIPVWVKLALALTSLLLVLSLLHVLRGRRKLAQALFRAHNDVVTGLPNRAAVDEVLRRMAAQAARRQTPLAVAMFDLDHFKSINDTYGHGKGDEVLAAVGAAARREVRSGDFVGRFGGEEFMILMPDTDEAGAYTVAETLRRAFREVGILGVVRTTTASFGVAGGRGTAEELLGLVPAADAALYRAKSNGRNRIEAASATVPSLEPSSAQTQSLALAGTQS